MDGNLRVAKVTAVHPEANAVDLIFIDTMAPVPMVQVMGNLGSRTGTADFPTPTSDANNPARETGDNDLYAIVASVGRGIPLVLGFLGPQVCELLFKDRPNFRVSRHASDFYTTIDDTGAFTMAWPNGTYLKVGEDPTNEDLTGQDFDAKWAIRRNKTRAPHVRLVVKDAAGANKASLDVAPDGSTTLSLGSLSLTVTGAITSSAASWTHTGDFHATGTITGDTDVVGGGKHLKTHTHGGVQTGSGNTGAPN